MNQLVSIIVPVYKVEDYLPDCVDSILGQTYRHLQIILVDDGSPDRCGALCDDYSKTDPRITVIHKANGGLSDARNVGMAAANGDYLMFVDSDDLLPSDAVETLLSLAVEHNAPLVIGNHTRFENEPLPPAAPLTPPQVLSKAEAMKDMFSNGCAAWARIYRKELHEGILYPCGELNEDEAIVLHLLDRCDRIVKTEKVVYYYRCREASITTTAFHKKKLAWMQHCKDNLEHIREKHPALETDAAMRYRESILWSLTEIALSDEDFSEEVRQMQAQLKQERTLFRAIPFDNAQERVRFFTLANLPFGIYRALIRLKRGR